MKYWGKLSVIDLFGCDKEILLDKRKVIEFNNLLCKNIKMKKVGKPIVKKFGKGILEGISSMQFIETSSIIIHADDKGDRAFIDIFSCKNFDSKKAVLFCKDFFKARKARVRTFLRG